MDGISHVHLPAVGDQQRNPQSQQYEKNRMEAEQDKLFHWICGNQKGDKIKLDIDQLYRCAVSMNDCPDCDNSERKLCCTTDIAACASYISKGPYPLYLYGRELPCNIDLPPDDLARYGCAYIEVKFKTAVPEIVKIVFENYYTASIEILIRSGHASCEVLNTNSNTVNCWRSICCKSLMPDPHYETGGQLEFVLEAKDNAEIEERWLNVSEARVILRQPSPVWKTFSVSNLRFYRERSVATSSTSSSGYLHCLLDKTAVSLNMKCSSAETTTRHHKSSLLSFSSPIIGYEIDKLPKM